MRIQYLVRSVTRSLIFLLRRTTFASTMKTSIDNILPTRRGCAGRKLEAMKNPIHEARGNSVYVGRVKVAQFTDEYAARRFAEYANRKAEGEENGNG
jgi:hypothetical protein